MASSRFTAIRLLSGNTTWSSFHSMPVSYLSGSLLVLLFKIDSARSSSLDCATGLYLVPKASVYHQSFTVAVVAVVAALGVALQEHYLADAVWHHR